MIGKLWKWLLSLFKMHDDDIVIEEYFGIGAAEALTPAQYDAIEEAKARYTVAVIKNPVRKPEETASSFAARKAQAGSKVKAFYSQRPRPWRVR